MSIRIKLFFSLFFACILLSSNAQDVSFTQPFANQLFLNPAYAGHPKYHRINFAYRNQWLTSQSPFMTYGASYDRYYIDYNSGVGINIVNDMHSLGAINNLNANLLYSYTFQVAYNIMVRGGVQAGGIFKTQNPKNLVFPDMIDEDGNITGTPGFSGQSKFAPDFATGFLVEWDDFYAGVALHHIAQPAISGIKGNRIVLHRKYSAQLGAAFNLYKRYLFRRSLILSPNIIYSQQLDVQEIAVGFYLRNNNLESGLWVKERIGFYNHTFAFVFGYHNEDFSFAYSYDFSLFQNNFRGLKTSSHEVTFSKFFEYKKRTRKKAHAINSPTF